MTKRTWLDDLLKELPLGKLPKQDKKKLIDYLVHEYNQEFERPPKIAIIGSSGVGKSSTINALFGSNLPVSHTTAGTLKPIEIAVSGKTIQGSKGNLILYDMPGIGEDIDKEEEYKEVYRKVISDCDVAVWVISAADRRYREDQLMIRDVLRPANKDLVDRLVIAVNKVDLVHPINWNKKANLPSVEQEHNLNLRIKDVKEKLRKVCPGLTEDRIVGYSATQRYNLDELFGAMLKACPTERAWVLNSRQEIADYWDLVSPELRKQAQVVTGGTK